MQSDAVVASPSSQPRGSVPGGPEEDSPAAFRAGGPRRSLRSGRSYLVAAGVALLAIWLVLVFGRALTDLNEANEREAAVGAQTAALEERLEAGQRELELVQSDAFQRMQARAYGMGRDGERAFGLEAGAPAPPQIVPLGSEGPSVQLTPLESWLRLLFGGG